ncbi:MAG: tryptophanase [candidate division Zixibacteria bacterium SM23_81]|nr:MAG: tryptophanase [candidate division Zixibacteria bacterium SM23_81]
MNVRLSTGKEIPMEMHKVRIVQKTSLVPVEERLRAIEEGGYNTFSLKTKDIFIDMLTDSGTNAMSDNQLAAMMVSDDAYAGSESFYKLAQAIEDVLGFKYVLPTHQGRAAEHLIAKVFIKPGDIIPMNYHFTTTKAHIELIGGQVLEIFADEALNTQSKHPFKGNLDIQKLKDTIKKYGVDKIPFVRMEATTNLLGGQPFSMENLKEVKRICSQHKIPLVLDGSLIAENAYFIKLREKGYQNKTIKAIIKEIMGFADLFYLSGRKSSCVRGGFIATNKKVFYEQIKPWLPVYEGFLTYGGMSSKEIEAMAVGIREMTDINVAGSAAEQVKYFAERLIERKIPVVTPSGGLACHVDAMMFLPHVPQSEYPAGALAAAIYIASGVRSMERGTISMDRDEEGNEVFSDLELARLAVPRRVYTIAHFEYVADRIHWLHRHRDLVKGLRFVEEPPVLRFFFGKLEPIDNWGSKLGEVFKKEVGAHW